MGKTSAHRRGKHHFFQAMTRAEAKEPGALAPDGARRGLQQPCLSRVPPELRMHGPRDKTEGRHRLADALGDAYLGDPAETARGDVDALLEERTVKRIGLVEDRQHLEPAVEQQPLQRDLRPRDEGLDQKQRSFILVPCIRHDGAHPLDGGRELPGVIGPNDPAAGRHRNRLDHAGKRDSGEIRPEAQIEDAKLGHLHPGRGQAGPRKILPA